MPCTYNLVSFTYKSHLNQVFKETITKVRNSKSDASIENGQTVLVVIIYTSDEASISDVVLMLLVLAFPATKRIVEAGTGSHTSLQPVMPTNGLISSH